MSIELTSNWTNSGNGKFREPSEKGWIISDAADGMTIYAQKDISKNASGVKTEGQLAE